MWRWTIANQLTIQHHLFFGRYTTLLAYLKWPYSYVVWIASRQNWPSSEHDAEEKNPTASSTPHIVTGWLGCRPCEKVPSYFICTLQKFPPRKMTLDWTRGSLVTWPVYTSLNIELLFLPVFRIVVMTMMIRQYCVSEISERGIKESFLRSADYVGRPFCFCSVSYFFLLLRSAWRSQQTFLFLFCFFFFLLYFLIFLSSNLRLSISPLFLNQSRWNLACW